MHLADFWGLTKEAFKEWSEDKAPRLAAALSYYTIFSLAPLLIVVIAIAGLVLGSSEVKDQVIAQIQGLVGDQGAQAINSMVQSANKPSANVIAAVIGIATLLLGASGVFGQLQDALNTIWEVKPKPGRGVLGMLKDRFMSFGAVLGTGFLLLVSLVISAAISALGAYLPGGQGQPVLWQIVNFLVSAIVMTVLFALLFKELPDVKIAWRDVWLGAGITTVLFLIGRFLIGEYLARAAFGSTYGAAGSLVIVLVWVYYSAQILFIGAEFTQVYARKFGSGINPAENAVRVTEEARAREGLSRAGGSAQPDGARERRADGRRTPRPSALAGFAILAAYIAGIVVLLKRRDDKPSASTVGAHQRA